MATFDSLKLLEQILGLSETKIRRRFLGIVGSMQDARTIEELADLLTAGEISLALDIIGTAGARLATTVNEVFQTSGTELLDAVSDRLGIQVSFDAVNFRAVEAMQRNRLDLIRAFSVKQEEATRNAITRGLIEGLNPVDQARRFRESIGLTPKQEEWVANYRRELQNLDRRALQRQLRDGRSDGVVRRAIDNDTPLSQKQIDSMVGRYRQRWIKHRSETIARTEALRSVNEGAEVGIEQMFEDSVLTPEDVRRFWNTSRDERVRDFDTGADTSHRSMHLQERGMREPFVSGAGNLLMRPGDANAPPEETIRCRCNVSHRISL